VRIRRLDHIHVYAADPEASVRFYGDMFKAEAIGMARTSYGGSMHFLRLGGLVLVVASFPPGVEPAPLPVYKDGLYQQRCGVAHFGLHVDNVDDAVESVRRRGGKILSRPRENSGLRFAYAGAPDGVIIELLEYGHNWATLRGAP
jgi:catechol 2,3-dioxygenase-like lactoylglutathione lyase family enzyme